MEALLDSFYEFDEVLANRPTPVYLDPRAPVVNPPGSTLVNALQVTNVSYLWVHRVKEQFADNVLAILRNLAANKVRTFVLFRTKHDEQLKDTFLMHLCSIPTKKACRCGVLNEQLISCRDNRTNCNYFISNKVNPFVYCLLLLKSNEANLLVQTIMVSGQRFTLNDFTEDLSKQLGCVVDFANLANFNPDKVLQKRWEKLTYGSFYCIAPRYFIPTDEVAEKSRINDALDSKLDGTAELQDDEQSFVNALNDPNADFIEKLLWRYLPIPLTHLHMVNDIVESPYANLRSSNPVYFKALEAFSSKMDNTEVADLFALLRDAEYAPRFCVFDSYRTRVDSVSCIQKWLRFQFGEFTHEFVTTLFKVVTRSNGKLNCIWLHGPGNAGKTHVIKSLCTLFISIGYVKSIDQASQFPFQGLHGKRIGLLDEFHIPKNFIDEFKELFSGASLPVNLKYQKGLQHTTPMPFICMSNDPPNVDLEDVIWSSRIKQYAVRTLPNDMFPASNHQLYPLAWLDIFNAECCKY